MSVFNKRLKLFSGNANVSLAEEIADYLGLYVGAAKVSRFSDGEICVAIDESVIYRMALTNIFIELKRRGIFRLRRKMVDVNWRDSNRFS